MPIDRSFVCTDHRAKTYTWNLHLHDPMEQPLQELAAELADRIMALRCYPSSKYRAWRNRVDGGPAHSAPTREALEAFIGPAFGLPAAPAPNDHLEGFVAEHLWYALTLDLGVDNGVVMITKPGFRTTAPGGDGLVVHRDAGVFSYRLWELKKCTGNAGISATVSAAYRQLESAGAKYLAEYTSIGQETEDDELASFFGDLVENWIEGAPSAAAGIAVHTSTAKVPTKCFTRFGTRFPRFLDPVRLRGMITAVDDFAVFSKIVREIVWTGL